MNMQERNIRFKGCCCFSLKTGCTIIGVLQIISALCVLWAFTMLSTGDLEGEFKRSFVEALVKAIPYDMTYMIMSLYCILHIASIPVSSIMIHGNVTNKKNLMTPFVWLYLFKISVTCVGYFMRLVFNFMNGNPSRGFDALWRLLLTGIASFLLLQVVRSRKMEIADENRQKIFSTDLEKHIPFVYSDKTNLCPA